MRGSFRSVFFFVRDGAPPGRAPSPLARPPKRAGAEAGRAQDPCGAKVAACALFGHTASRSVGSMLAVRSCTVLAASLRFPNFSLPSLAAGRDGCKNGRMETRDRIHEKRLLVVDDAPEIRALVRAVLEDEGYTNLAFAAGHAEALAEFQRVSPEFALLDVMLPDGDGFSLARQLRAMDPNLPRHVPHGEGPPRRPPLGAYARRRRLPGEALPPPRAHAAHRRHPAALLPAGRRVELPGARLLHGPIWTTRKSTARTAAPRSSRRRSSRSLRRSRAMPGASSPSTRFARSFGGRRASATRTRS